MQFTTATHQHRPALQALGMQVFGDDADFVNRSLDTLAGAGNVYVALQQDTLIAQLYAVPSFANGTQGHYLYALATAPAARGSGVMTQLMAYAEQQLAAAGSAFCALIPANPPLFAYYAKRGYAQPIMLRHLKKDIPPGAPGGPANFSAFSAARWLALRAQYISSAYIGFSQARSEMILQDVYDSGGQAAQSQEAYALYYQATGRLIIAESFGLSNAAVEQLAAAIAQKTGHICAHFTLPAAFGPFAGQGEARPYALYKPLCAVAQHATPPHLRFGFDELA